MVGATGITGENSSEATIILTASIPSAGTWQISAQISCSLAASQLCVFGLFDGTETLVPDTESTAGYIGPGTSYQGQGTSVWTITTVDAEDYTVRAWAGGGVTGCTIESDGAGRTFVTWTQLTGGYVGATGSTGSSFKTSTSLSFSVEPVEGSTGQITVDTGLAYIAGNSVLLQNASQVGFEAIITSYDSFDGEMSLSQITNIEGTIVGSSNPFNVDLTGKRGSKIFYGTSAPTINARAGDLFINTSSGQIYNFN
jgi:hypothetical protein